MSITYRLNNFFYLNKINKIIFFLVSIVVLSLTLFNQYLPLLFLMGIIIFSIVIGGIDKGIYLLLFIIPFSPSIELTDVGGRTIGLTAEYALTAVIIVAWCLQKIFLGQLSFRCNSLVTPLFLLLIIIILSLFRAWTEIGGNNIISGVIPFIGFFEYICLFLIIIDTFRKPEQVKFAIKIVFIACLLSGVINLIFYVFQSDNLYRLQPVFDSLFRKEGVHSNPNSYAAYLMIVYFAGFCFLEDFNRSKRPWLIIISIVMFVTIILTGSRSVFLGIISGTFIFGLIKRNKLIPLILLIGLISLFFISEKYYNRYSSILVILSNKEIHNLFSRVQYEQVNWEDVGIKGFKGYRTDVVAGALRLMHWIEGLKMIKFRPLLGYGYHLKQYFSFSPSSESYFLDIWIMTGIFGLIIILHIFYKLGYFALYLYKMSDSFLKNYGIFFIVYLSAVVVISLTGSVLFSSKVAAYFWSLSACLCALQYEKNSIN